MDPSMLLAQVALIEAQAEATAAQARVLRALLLGLDLPQPALRPFVSALVTPMGDVCPPHPPDMRVRLDATMEGPAHWRCTRCGAECDAP